MDGIRYKESSIVTDYKRPKPFRMRFGQKRTHTNPDLFSGMPMVDVTRTTEPLLRNTVCGNKRQIELQKRFRRERTQTNPDFYATNGPVNDYMGPVRPPVRLSIRLQKMNTSPDLLLNIYRRCSTYALIEFDPFELTLLNTQEVFRISYPVSLLIIHDGRVYCRATDITYHSDLFIS